MDQDRKILCVDDEENVLRSIKRLLMDEEYEVITAPSGGEGLKLLSERAPVQIVVSDYRMPVMSGVEFLREVRTRWPDTVRIVLSGYADTSAVVAAINEGRIYKFIPKPWNDDELKVTIANAFERYALHEQNNRLSLELKKKNEELTFLNRILKERISERVGELEERIKKLSRSDATLGSLPLAVVGLDHGGWIAYYNDKAVRLFSWHNNDLLNAKRTEVFQNDLNALIDRAFSAGTCADRVMVRGREMTAQAFLVALTPGEKGITLVFAEDDYSRSAA